MFGGVQDSRQNELSRCSEERELLSMRQLPLPQDLEWIESLFKLYSKRVRAFAIRRVGPDAADDVVSEVFGIAWKRRPNVPEPALPWLLRT